MHEIITPLRKGFLKSAPSRCLPATVPRHRRSIGHPDKKTESSTEPRSPQALKNTEAPGRPRNNAGDREGYLKARVKILNALPRNRKTPVDQTFGTPLHHKWQPRIVSRNGEDFSRLVEGPKLRGLRDRKYWLCIKPFLKKAGLEGRRKKDRDSARKFDLATKKMRSYVQVITTPTADTPGTLLLLHFDNARYLLGNISEGAQRACIQQKVGLAKVNNIFLTGKVNWGTTGGLLGMILTLADVVISSRAAEPAKKRDADEAPDPTGRLVIHGGKNLTHLLATARRFVFRKGMPVDLNEFRANLQRNDDKAREYEPTWSDRNIKVWAMSILPDTVSSGQRKRSLDDMLDEKLPKLKTPITGDEMETDEEVEDRNHQIRRAVVTHMFQSEWRLDTLKKVKLSDVRLPAAIFVRNEAGKIEKYRGPLPGAGELVPDIDVLIRTPWPGAMIESLPPTTPSAEAMCYIVKNHQQRGKFDAKAAVRLGVKPGPTFRQLTLGNNVTTSDGKVVTPDMVIGPSKQGGGLVVVELPDRSYIDSLINRGEWSSAKVMAGIHGIFWILGKGVIEDERLVAFMRNHSELHHTVSSSDVCPNVLALQSPAQAAIKLNLLDPERFPVPMHSNDAPHKMDSKTPFHNARAGVTMLLEPQFEVQDKNVIGYLDTSKVIEDADPEMLRLADEAREMVNSKGYRERLDELQKDIPSKDAEVIALGTGSALPSKYRNVSATLLRVPGYGSYLFDCGENTLGQLKRVFGDDGLVEVLKDLKAIWISHLHADHHLGTASVVRAWHEETLQHADTKDATLLIASDDGMLNWLTEYASIEAYGFPRLTLLPLTPTAGFSHDFSPATTAHLGLSRIHACRVDHCHGALAVVLHFPHGFRAAYSGDCLPSSEFATIGADATLLIHEATFDDELAGDALAKKHCTTSDALGVAKAMNARRVLLTHFSQRYQKVPVMSDGEEAAGKRTDGTVAVVAFDYMRCRIGDFRKLAAFRPALLKLYETEVGVSGDGEGEGGSEAVMKQAVMASGA